MSEELKWRPISDAPVCSELLTKEPPTCLVWSREIGVHMGRAWVYADGQPVGQAFGFHGDWNITHWMPLPAPPKDEQ